VCLMTRMETQGHNAKRLFIEDVEGTHKRICDRVKVLLSQEKEEEEKEKALGLKRVEAATQEDGSLALPREGDEDAVKRADAFASLPSDLQRALLTQDVDDINAALQKIPQDDMERLMTIATGAGLIEVELTDDPDAEVAE
jgi:cell division cycle protein 37